MKRIAMLCLAIAVVACGTWIVADREPAGSRHGTAAYLLTVGQQPLFRLRTLLVEAQRTGVSGSQERRLFDVVQAETRELDRVIGDLTSVVNKYGRTRRLLTLWTRQRAVAADLVEFGDSGDAIIGNFRALDGRNALSSRQTELRPKINELELYTEAIRYTRASVDERRRLDEETTGVENKADPIHAPSR